MTQAWAWARRLGSGCAKHPLSPRLLPAGGASVNGGAGVEDAFLFTLLAPANADTLSASRLRFLGNEPGKAVLTGAVAMMHSIGAAHEIWTALLQYRALR